MELEWERPIRKKACEDHLSVQETLHTATGCKREGFFPFPLRCTETLWSSWTEALGLVKSRSGKVIST